MPEVSGLYKMPLESQVKTYVPRLTLGSFKHSENMFGIIKSIILAAVIAQAGAQIIPLGGTCTCFDLHE